MTEFRSVFAVSNIECDFEDTPLGRLPEYGRIESDERVGPWPPARSQPLPRCDPFRLGAVGVRDRVRPRATQTLLVISA